MFSASFRVVLLKRLKSGQVWSVPPPCGIYVVSVSLLAISIAFILFLKFVFIIIFIL